MSTYWIKNIQVFILFISIALSNSSRYCWNPIDAATVFLNDLPIGYIALVTRD